MSILLATAPLTADFVFTLEGVPVGTVTLAQQSHPPRFRYTSVHWLNREGNSTARRRSVELPVDEARLPAARLPAALWLLHRPNPGCRPVRDELSGRLGEGCARAGAEGNLEGALFGQPFRAEYSPEGSLVVLRLGKAVFRRTSDRDLPRVPPDLFLRDVPVEGEEGELHLEPELASFPAPVIDAWSAEEAGVLMGRVLESFDGDGPGPADLAQDPREGRRGGCLGHARRFERWARDAAGHARAAVVYGFYAPVGSKRAGAHAWVMVRTETGMLMLDPTLGAPVTPRTHLALGVASEAFEAGALYLSLYAGERHILRGR